MSKMRLISKTQTLELKLDTYCIKFHSTISILPGLFLAVKSIIT